MKFTRPLPKFDPRSVPVVGIDDHLEGVAAFMAKREPNWTVLDEQ